MIPIMHSGMIPMCHVFIMTLSKNGHRTYPTTGTVSKKVGFRLLNIYDEKVLQAILLIEHVKNVELIN